MAPGKAGRGRSVRSGAGEVHASITDCRGGKAEVTAVARAEATAEAAMIVPLLRPPAGRECVNLGLNVVRVKVRTDTVTTHWGQFGGGMEGGIVIEGDANGSA